MSEPTKTEHAPLVTRTGLASMQVCVPEAWTDVQVITFADTQNPTGLDHGWAIRKQGDPALAGVPERVACSGPSARAGCVHVMLDC